MNHTKLASQPTKQSVLLYRLSVAPTSPATTNTDAIHWPIATMDKKASTESSVLYHYLLILQLTKLPDYQHCQLLIETNGK